jgi:WD40 repeat protein
VSGSLRTFRTDGVMKDLVWLATDRLALGFEDGRVVFCRPSDGVRGPGFQAGTHCRALAWSPAEGLLAAGGGDGKIVCWSEARKAVVKTAPVTTTDGSRLGIVSLSLDGKSGRLLAGTGDGLLVGLEWPGLVLKERSVNGNQWVASTVALAESGTWLSGGSEGRLVLHRSGNEAGQTLYQAPETAVNLIAVLKASPDGRLVAVACGDGSIQLRDGAEGALVEILRGHRTVLRGLAFSPDGARLYSAGNDGMVRVWRLRSSLAAPRTALPAGERGATLDPQALEKAAEWLPAKDSGMVPTAAAFSADRRWLAWGATDMKVRLVDLSKSDEPLIREGHGSDVTALLFAPDGKSLVSAGQDGTLFVWNLPDMTRRFTLPGHQFSVTGLAADPAFRLLFSGAVGDQIRVWDLDTGKLVKILRTSISWPSDMAYFPGGSLLWFKSAHSDDAEIHPLLLDQSREGVRELARSWATRFTAFTLDDNGNPSFAAEAGSETLRQSVDPRLFAPWYDRLPGQGLIDPAGAAAYDQTVREALDKAIRAYNDEWLMQYAG